MERILDIEPVTLDCEYFCWAGCIQMVATFYNLDISQCTIFKEIKHYDCVAETLEMSSTEKYYKDFFQLYGIKSVQNYINKFPDFKFIINQIDSKKPLIYSGIWYPIMSCQHAITAVGYYVDKNQPTETDDINILLINDPTQKNYKYRAAWVYRELIEHQLPKKDLHFDFIHSFTKQSSEKLNETIEFDTHSVGYAPICLNENSDLKYNEDILQNFILSFIKRNAHLLADFFKLQKDFTLLSSINYISIDFTNLEKLIEDNNKKSFGAIRATRLNNSNNVLLSFYWKEKSPNCFSLLCITNSYDELVKQAYLNQGNDKFVFDHEEPNYEIVNIEPINLTFYYFLYNDSYYFSPTQAYGGSFILEQAYNIKEIETQINKILNN